MTIFLLLLLIHSIWNQTLDHNFQSMFEKSDPIAYQILTSQHNIEAYIDIKAASNQTVINVIGDEKEEKSIVCQTSDLVYNISTVTLIENPGKTVFWDTGANALFAADKFMQISSNQTSVTLQQIDNTPRAVVSSGTPAEIADFSDFNFFRIDPIPYQNDFIFDSQFVIASNGRFKVYNERLKSSITFVQPNVSTNQANIVFTSPSAKNQFWVAYFDAQSVLLTFHLITNSSVRENKAMINLNKYLSANDAQKERISFSMLYHSDLNAWFVIMVTKSLGIIRFIFNETQLYANLGPLLRSPRTLKTSMAMVLRDWVNSLLFTSISSMVPT